MTDKKPKPELGALRAARELAERMTAGQADLSSLAASLREPISRLPPIGSIPSAEAIATGQVQGEIERLSEITAALLDLGRQQLAAMEAARRTADRAANVIIALTAVLVLLTYVIAADALGWWPFAAAGHA